MLLSVPYWRDALRYVYYGFLKADFQQRLPFYSLARFYSPSLDIAWISVTAGVIVWLERKQTKSYILLGVWAASHSDRLLNPLLRLGRLIRTGKHSHVSSPRSNDCGELIDIDIRQRQAHADRWQCFSARQLPDLA